MNPAFGLASLEEMERRRRQQLAMQQQGVNPMMALAAGAPVPPAAPAPPVAPPVAPVPPAAAGIGAIAPVPDPRAAQIAAAARAANALGAPQLPTQMPAMPTPPAGPARPQLSPTQQYLQRGLAGMGAGAATESPYGLAGGVGLGLLGAYLNRRGRKKPQPGMKDGGVVRLAMGGAGKERKDYPRTKPSPKRPKGIGKATRGHKIWD